MSNVVESSKAPDDALLNESCQTLVQCVRELDGYFAGRLKNFTVQTIITGTPFQVKAWEALTKIPYGDTISYKQLAANIGAPKAVRAVGGANNKNKISIIIPCHRVIGADGGLVGYGGGLDNKKFLLDLEQGALYNP